MESKPPSFTGDGGALELLGWTERIEAVFNMCDSPQEKKVKFAASTFVGTALSWWNSQIQTRGLIEAHAMTWPNFKALLEKVYCPRSEIMKLEHEYGNLKMVGSEIEAYTTRSHKLATLCPHHSTPMSRRIEFYIKGLVPEIQGSVTAARFTEIEDVVSMALLLTNQAVDQGKLPPRTSSSSSATTDNKRKWDVATDKSNTNTTNPTQPNQKKPDNNNRNHNNQATSSRGNNHGVNQGKTQSVTLVIVTIRGHAGSS